MAKLTVFLEGTQIDEIEMKIGKEYLIGRGTMCNIVLDHPKVSRQHIKIEFDGANWHCHVISRFGNVQLNGHAPSTISRWSTARDSRRRLTELHFSDSKTEKSITRSKTGKTGQTKAVSDGDSGTIALDEKTQAGGLQLQATLLRIEGGEIIEEIKVGRDKMTAGRSQGCEITLKAPEASRRHFTVEFDGHNFVVTDLKSANKTYVNEKEISKQILESGDIITIGTDEFRFELVHPDFDDLSTGVMTGSQNGLIPAHSGNFPSY